MPAALHFGLGVLPYFPLANGLLTGKVRRGSPPPEGSRLAGRPDYITDAKLDTVEALSGWAAGHGLTVLEVAVGGLAALPGCASVIAGATSAEQVKANAEAGSWIPTADDLAEIGLIVPARRVSLRLPSAAGPAPARQPGPHPGSEPAAGSRRPRSGTDRGCW